jgi:hypothetical protein
VQEFEDGPVSFIDSDKNLIDDFRFSAVDVFNQAGYTKAEKGGNNKLAGWVAKDGTFFAEFFFTEEDVKNYCVA